MMSDSEFSLFTVAREASDIIHDNGDVLRDGLVARHDVSHRQLHQQQQQQQQQHIVYSGRQGNTQRVVSVSEPVGVNSLSDVLLTRMFHSGLRSDDLCRCAAVCRRWNRLVWNPLLWTSIDVSQATDCDADLALRSACTPMAKACLQSDFFRFRVTEFRTA